MRQFCRTRELFAGACVFGLMVGGVGQSDAADCGRPAGVVEGTFAGVNVGDGSSFNDVCLNAERAGDAWFEYVAPQTGVLNLSVRGKAAKHAISVWEGCPNRGGGDLVCRDDGWELQTVAGASVIEGSTYRIRVASLGKGEDSFEIDVNFETMAEATAGGERAPGPDVTYQAINAIAKYGPVGTKHAFFTDSGTCNIGNQNLRWGGSWAGSPSLATNLYRLKDGRLTQIGQSWTKQACCAAAGSGCGSCNGTGGSLLGAGCRDFYGASYNGGQSRLGPRSNLNAFTGAHILAPTNSGDAIFKRLQAEQADIDPLLNPGALWFFEGVYVASDDAPVGNNLNNSSYRRAVPSAGFNFSLADTTQQLVPAITAWRLNGLGAGVVDNRVVDGILDVPNEGRFHTAYKVTDLGGGNYRYDYAIFNLTSDRSGGSFSVPLNGATPVNIGFNDVEYHSGEPYDNTNWNVSVAGGAITWRSPQTFAQNANSNALRWGTMYNFWFETNRAPQAGSVELGLFKPHTPQAVSFNASVPSGPAILLGDMNCDGLVSVGDIAGFVLALTDPFSYAIQFPGCQMMAADVNQDGVISVGDIAGFVALLTQ